jgi:hypothetical protein
MASKYDRLADHLVSLDAPVITLTFAKVEAIVGPLPWSARHTWKWWGVTDRGSYQYPHATHWRRAGFVADRPDFAAETVTFHRVPLGEPRAISIAPHRVFTQGKYDALTAHLAASEADTLTLTFAEVEAIVGPLPLQARQTAWWWGASAGGRYFEKHIIDWRHLGWAADRPDFAAERVTFRHTRDR